MITYFHTKSPCMMHAQLLQSCPTLCDPMDCSPPGSPVGGILQERILEWVVMPFSKGSSWPRIQTHISYLSYIAGRFFTHWAIGEALKLAYGPFPHPLVTDWVPVQYRTLSNTVTQHEHSWPYPWHWLHGIHERGPSITSLCNEKRKRVR